MAKRDEDQDWLDTIGGNPDPNADPALVRKATVLRNAIRQYDSRLMGEKYDIDGELQRLNTRLSKEGLFPAPPQKQSFARRWAALIAAILSAIAFGALTMRLAMMPALEGVRSEGNVSIIDGQQKLAQSVPVLVPDPAETMKASVAEASRLGLNFSVKAAGNGYDLLVEGLVPHSANQESLKQVLGIGAAAAGDLQFQIRRKSSK